MDGNTIGQYIDEHGRDAVAVLVAAISRAEDAETYLERIRVAMGGYADSDLASLAETLRKRNDALEAEVERLRAALRIVRRKLARDERMAALDAVDAALTGDDDDYLEH